MNNFSKNPLASPLIMAVFAALSAALLVPDKGQAQGAGAPTVSGTTVSDSSQGAAAASLTLTAGTSARYYVYATVTDPDGCEDFTLSPNGTIALYRSDLGASCGADERNCYTHALVIADFSGCAGPGDNDAVAEAYFDLQYLADPTDVADKNFDYSSLTWQATVTVLDSFGLSGTETIPIELASLTALDVTRSIDYGIVSPGVATQGATQTVTISNTGNRTITASTQANGDLVCDALGTILAEQIMLTSSTFAAYQQPLDAGLRYSGLSLAKAVSSASPSSENWSARIDTPGVVGRGICSNTVTWTAEAAS